MGKERPYPLATLQWKNLCLVCVLIMGRTVRIRERRGPQFKLESLAVYDSEGAVAVVQLQQELRHLLACMVSTKRFVIVVCVHVVGLFPELRLRCRRSQNLGPHFCACFDQLPGQPLGKRADIEFCRTVGNSRGDDGTLSERMEMLVQHRQSLNEQIRQLQEHEAMLDEKIAFYRQEIEGHQEDTP